MINNRTLAIAAVLALTVPAVGAAAPVYFNPLTEQLVEGHTVFAVLEVVDKTTRERNHFAAAVAVLVRENVQVRELQRFPGVLWFNDQYLYGPSDSDRNAKNIRYPCGGAVLAVNEGSPDPRVMLGPGTDVTVTGAGTVPVGAALDNRTGFVESKGFGEDHGDDWLDNDSYESDYAWLGNVDATVDPAGSATVSGYTDATTGAFSYLESYLITDPNDHMWQIDVYEGNTRVYLSDLTTAVTTTFNVWVVNMLGSPVFRPDDGRSNCPPFIDLGGAGYASPSTNNYCYNGNPNGGDADGDGNPDYPTCNLTDLKPTQPVRLYNALLYMKLEHLTVDGTPRDHGAAGNQDTNGCQVYTEWACPNGDDNAEGFSHPFHPDPTTGATTVEEGSCPETFYQVGGERSNHGGSTTAESGVWYDGEARYNGRGYCDEIHRTKNIDLYFNGEARPFPPVVPNFVITDLEGRAAPYHCEHTPDLTSAGTVAPGEEPDNPDCSEKYYDPTN